MISPRLSRRAFLRWSTLGAGAVALAACTGAPVAAPAGGNAGAAAATPVAQMDVGAATGNNYSFMTISTDAEASIFDGLAARFMETNPGGEWTFDRLSGSWEDFSRKYITELAGGAPHDVARIAIIHKPSYVGQGYVNDLTPFFEASGLNMSDYYESAFDEWIVDDKLYGIPTGIYNMAIYYNKDMFDKAGLAYPPTDWEDASWDLEAFRAAAKALTSGEGTEKQYGFATNWDIRWVIHFLWLLGGDFINPEHTQCVINQPEAVEGLQFIEQMVREDKSWLTPMQLGNTDTFGAFMSGQVGMYLDGMWQMPAAANIEDFNWGMAPVPLGPAGRYTGIYVDAWVMPPGVKNEEQSWKFLEYMAGADAQNYLVDNSMLGLPILRSVVQERSADLFKPLPPEEQQVWINAANYARSFPFTAKWDELYEALTPIWDLWGLEEIDAVEMAQQFCDVMDPILAQQ